MDNFSLRLRLHLHLHDAERLSEDQIDFDCADRAFCNCSYVYQIHTSPSMYICNNVCMYVVLLQIDTMHVCMYVSSTYIIYLSVSISKPTDGPWAAWKASQKLKQEEAGQQ